MSKHSWVAYLPVIVALSLGFALAQQSEPRSNAENIALNRADLYQRFINTVPGMNMPALTDMEVPAVPCPTTTMSGETSLPALPTTLTMKVPAYLGDRITYYKGTGAIGVMGPRGWTCRQHFGSVGSFLKIAPIGAAFEEDAKYESNIKYSGEIIQRDFSIGGSAGRYEVARVAALIFPIIKDFVEQVRAGGADISGDRLPGDTYFYLSPSVAAFRTSRNDEGIAGWATIGPAFGLAYLTREPGSPPDLTLLNTRLGTQNADLVPIILADEILQDERSISVNPNPLPAEPEGPHSLWAHNGSTVYLVAQGASREYRYQQPRPGMIEAGARAGTVVFKGVIREGNYEGTAYIFKHGCRPAPYQVTGPILDDGRRVLMRGLAPKLDERCQVTGYIADTLEFTLVAAASSKP